MPKDRRENSSSSNRAATSSPYARHTKALDPNGNKNSLPPRGDEREWEEARCPICVDHPHNAVLLQCSNNCRPFMCDTSSRHSNCLDQFRKSAQQVDQRNPKLVCPLCRGTVRGWTVIEPARRYMNSKTRSCALETCDFSGNYEELRKHARVKHPSCKPSEVSHTRRSNWRTLEQEMDIADALAYASDMDYDMNGWSDLGSEDDLYDGFFDFSPIFNNDELVDEILGTGGFSLSSFFTFPSFQDEMIIDIDIGGSRNAETVLATPAFDYLGSRSNSVRESNARNRSSRLNYRRETGNGTSRSISRGSGNLRARSSHHQETGSRNARLRPDYHRESARTSSSMRSSRSRENEQPRTRNERVARRPLRNETRRSPRYSI